MASREPFSPEIAAGSSRMTGRVIWSCRSPPSSPPVASPPTFDRLTRRGIEAAAGFGTGALTRSLAVHLFGPWIGEGMAGKGFPAYGESCGSAELRARSRAPRIRLRP
jgi:hypothetical protein